VGFARAAAISLNLQVDVANREVRLSGLETDTER
jgi:hypothetical protein